MYGCQAFSAGPLGSVRGCCWLAHYLNVINVTFKNARSLFLAATCPQVTVQCVAYPEQQCQGRTPTNNSAQLLQLGQACLRHTMHALEHTFSACGALLQLKRRCLSKRDSTCRVLLLLPQCSCMGATIILVPTAWLVAGIPYHQHASSPAKRGARAAAGAHAVPPLPVVWAYARTLSSRLCRTSLGLRRTHLHDSASGPQGM